MQISNTILEYDSVNKCDECSTVVYSSIISYHIISYHIISYHRSFFDLERGCRFIQGGFTISVVFLNFDWLAKQFYHISEMLLFKKLFRKSIKS